MISGTRRWPTTLWIKAWYESRSRFLIGVGLVCLWSAAFLMRARTQFPPQNAPPLSFSAFVWREMIGNERTVAFAWMALVLGLGGMQREREAKTAAFTLVLPVTRFQFVSTRAMIGLAQVALLALIPAMAIPLLSPIIAHQSYPLEQAVQFAALYSGWGVVFFGLGFLWSTLFPGAYTAIAACVVTPFALIFIHAYVFGFDDRIFPVGNFSVFMGGLPYVDPMNRGSMLLTRIPWIPLVALGGVALLLLISASAAVKRMDF